MSFKKLVRALRTDREKLEAVRRLLEENGDDCDCGCDTDGHGDDCEPCLACRIQEAIK